MLCIDINENIHDIIPTASVKRYILTSTVFVLRSVASLDISQTFIPSTQKQSLVLIIQIDIQRKCFWGVSNLSLLQPTSNNFSCILSLKPNVKTSMPSNVCSTSDKC